jgi:hypothetical protein
MGKGREPIFWLSQVSFPSGVAKHGITTGLQAAYMARAFIIAKAADINRFLAVLASLGRKEDGSGVIYKERLPCIFPIGAPEQPTYSLKAGFMMMRGVRRQMKGMKFVRVAMLQDVTPGLPQCFIFSNNQNATFVIWRLRGDVNMKFTPPPGVTMSARDGYGNPMPIGAKGGKSMLTVGPFPTFVQVPAGSMAKFEQALLAAAFEPVTGKPTSWRSRLVGHLNLDSPQQRQAHQYKVVGGKVAREKAATTSGKVVEGSCATFEGEESFKVKLPSEKTPFDLVIVRSLLMTEKGESITVSCNDQEVGKLVFGMGLKPKNAYRLWSHETIVVPAEVLKKNPKEALIKIKTDPARKGVKARSGSYWFYIKPAGQALNLSDLEPLAYRRPWGQLYHDSNIGGAVFDVSGKEYPRGLGTTADSRITFIIGGKFKTLTGKIGIDALAENNTRVRASIYLDGRVAWNQRGIKKGMKPVEFEVPMDGKSQIILEVRSESGKLRYDFVDWLNVELR